MSEDNSFNEDHVIELIRSELDQVNPSTRQRILEKFALAALGSIPWVGGFLSAAASLKTDQSQSNTDSLQRRWLEEHTFKLERLQATLNDLAISFKSLGNQINERVQSEEYLTLVRQAFRTWDKADTDEKRKYVANLISNASGTSLCSDDVLSLFIDWLDLYHESHFAVIREIYKQPGSTRFDIWKAIHGAFPREDSAEADLYRLLIRDLSTGGVLRQARATTADGQFLKKTPSTQKKRRSSRTMESSFEDSKPYVLTELGKQFVHYTMNEVVPRVDSTSRCV